MVVSAKLRKPSQPNQPRGSCLCGSNCLPCKCITVGLKTYTFHSTGETRPINHHIDCNSKNVIYLVQCKRCHKQYIGETKRRLNPIQTGLGGGGLSEPAPTLKIRNFQTVKAMTTKFRDFSLHLSGNILTLVSLVHQH